MHDATEAPCWFCGDNRGSDTPPGGWIYEDTLWRAGHLPHTYGPEGLVVVESQRHFLDASNMDDAEAAALGPVLKRVTAAIREVTAAQRVYTWASMVAFPHMHLWLMPWLPGRPEGAGLISAAHAFACTPEEALHAADALRRVLA